MTAIDINSDKERLDKNLIIEFLHNHSYWAKNRQEEVIRDSIENSFCIGVYADDRQIGFSRIITDYATFYYLADVFIIPEYQNRGIGHKLMDYIMNLDFIKKCRGILTTQTAHSFYRQYGFETKSDIILKRMMVKAPGSDLE